MSWAHRLFCSSCEPLPNSRNCGKEFQYLRDSLFGIRVSSVLGRPQSVEARTDMSTSALSDITDTQYYYIRTSISQLYFDLILSTVCFVFQDITFITKYCIHIIYNHLISRHGIPEYFHLISN